MFAGRISGLPLGLFTASFLILCLAHVFGTLPAGLPGALAFTLMLGGILGYVGDRIPVWNKYIGGGPVLVFLGAAWMVYAGILNEAEVKSVTNLMKSSHYIDLFIGILIVGNILALKRTLLIQSLIGYIPTILIALAMATLFGICAGTLVGIQMEDILMLYVLPIMGGGNGAGAIPLSEIYESVTGNSRETYYSKAVSILTIANIISIILAALLNRVGNIYPLFSGQGQLVRNGLRDLRSGAGRESIAREDLLGGLTLAVVFCVMAEVFSKVLLPGWGNIQIHRYAWLVVLVTLLNVSGVIPENLKAGAKKTADFLSKELLWVLMVGVGIAYTNLGEVIEAINPITLFVAIFIVVGATLGAAFGGRLFGFYEIESAITAGLCMANRGGSGDLEVLAASKRMNLLCYAQISSRLGGGIVLVIGAVIFGAYG
ncbi:2-hydroxycarboxylate transporter family protein [Sansalvadorimonas sp. 2012CJ34-2]|uniref:2-hydroxycarboxylate transporter family protein n=1 Tax=Parendozoicomonas callyspongiae TaxID=2942213 RepID=A0ABT0PB23_9GAMM|nr:2-hydroxycarboxylate transporter family protein [Sansalvadorimonas sp. 2012CJ34-2]MCL6268584.1 2-hydroxycarboxylate transporter family protein [Sansalvadorimonas sp. 2012CJ34-2]